MGGEIDIPDPSAGKTDEGVPVAGEGKLENNAENTVVVILDFTGETLAAFESERLDGFDDRRALIADVTRSRMLEAGLKEGARAYDLLELVEANLLAGIKLDEDPHGAVQRDRNGLGCGIRHFWKSGVGRIIATMARCNEKAERRAADVSA
jgi:hypothetical protein